MDPLFIIQLICCTFFFILAVQLALGSLQMKWKVRRYEVSRWMLCAAMLLFALQFFLQMVLGWRAKGVDVGMLFNILFFTPLSFIFTLAILNLESPVVRVRRHCLGAAMVFSLMVIVFVIGFITKCSLHIGEFLYVMLALFVISMAYYIVVHRSQAVRLRKDVLENHGGDIVPFEHFSMVSSTLLCFSAATLPVVILSNKLIIIVGPLILLTIIIFIQSFISIGFYLTPKATEDISAEIDKEEEADGQNGNVEETASASSSLSEIRIRQIKQALARWCGERRYQDSSTTIFSLAENIGCKKSELTEYFNQSAHTNFRTWLSDIRFNESVRMMKSCPNYSNDAISIECGFSSHTQIYRLFKQRTGLSPNQWRDKMCSSAC